MKNMVNIIGCIGLVLTLTGCQTTAQKQEKPTGEWRWYNKSSITNVMAGVITREEYEHKFTVDKNICKMESLKIPIPSPSCTQPPKMDCTGKTGAVLGFCSTYVPPRQCDYSSVTEAYKSRTEILESCFVVAGYEKDWFDFTEQQVNQKFKFGISNRPLTKEIRTLYGVDQGSFVSNVFSRSPAEKAGVKIKDIIIAVDGVTVSNSDEAVLLMRTIKLEQKTSTLTIVRDNKTIDIDIVF